MKPKIGLICLGVRDVQRAKKFYKGLGFFVHGEEKEGEDHVMFSAQGTWLSLYPWDKLAQDAKISSVGTGFRGITLAHCEPTKEDVDQVLDEAQMLGATIVKEARDAEWGGYSGYFQDSDGHLWEVAMNPFTDLT